MDDCLNKREATEEIEDHDIEKMDSNIEMQSQTMNHLEGPEKEQI